MTSQKDIKVLLVDDYQMMRISLRKLINEQQDMAVIGEANDGEQAVKFIKEECPDIAIIDVNMPEMDGLEATKKILSIAPNTIIIALSLHDSRSIIDDMLKAGASAYLTKNDAFDSLCATIRDVVNSSKNT